MRRDDTRALARDVFASLDGTPAVAVRLLAASLQFMTGPIGEFAAPLDYYADVLEYDVRDGLATVAMAYTLRRAAWVDADELLDRLEGVEAAPWPQIRAAVVALRDRTCDP